MKFIFGRKNPLSGSNVSAISEFHAHFGYLHGIFHAIPPNAKAFDMLTPKERAVIRGTFIRKVEYYSKIMNVTVGRVTIRNQKTRWGSCSSKGNVNFNYNLYYMPEELLDYVVVHELSHRKYMNHSQSFWCEVEKYCPEYKLCRRRLKDYTLSI